MAPIPSVSVLIPTRNRPTLARLAVESALAAVPADGEVVVADNSDRPTPLDFDDPRLRVLRADRVLSMPDNWERVLGAARGEWLVMLEDKSRIARGAIERLLDLASDQWSVVTYQQNYFQQDVEPAQAEDPDRLRSAPGSLEWMSRTVQVRLRNSQPALRQVLERGLEYNYHHLPQFLNAIIHRDIVERVRRRIGRFFIGMNPDLSSCLNILAETHQYLETTLPATLIQWPTRRREAWSNAFAFLQGTRSRMRFFSEFGAASPLDRYRLPPTAMGGLFETFLEFRRVRPEVMPEVQIPWDHFAVAATYEIERYPPEERWRLHAQVLRATQHGMLRPGAAYRQLRALAGLQLGRIRPVIERARATINPPAAGESPATDTAAGPAVTQPVAAPEEDTRRETTSEASLIGALESLSRRCREPAVTPERFTRSN